MSDIFYKTYGNGDINVLMIHGWASSHTMWKHVYPHLNNATIYAIDLPGFGQSDIGGSALTIEAHMQTVIQFCEEHGKPQMIIGHSMGGLITLKTLILRPHLAEQVVLLCPVVTGRFGALGGLGSDIMRNELAVNALRASKNLWTTIQNEYLLSATAPLMHDNPELAQQMIDNFMLARPEAGIEAIVSMAKQNTLEHLTELQHETLVCVSEGDPTVPHTEGRTAAMYMPNAELAVFTESRHHPMDEEPDKFIPIFRDFVSRFGL